VSRDIADLLAQLGVPANPAAIAIGPVWAAGSGRQVPVRSPIDGRELATLRLAAAADSAGVITAARQAFAHWRDVPAPRRGEFVRRFGARLRENKDALGLLVAWEAGKIVEEGLGEVQEMIDICDFAVGLSRQLYGLTMASERPGHRLAEYWHPFGPVAVISAFNFPVAVWAWNATVGWVCGNTLIWKPSEKTPLTAIACQSLAARVLEEMELPGGISSLLAGGADVGQALAESPAVPLVSATGSVAMGRAVAATLARRLGRALLELGGNNGAIVTPSADLELALRAIVFSAAGTCGQRCTTLRRLIVHRSIADALLERLLTAYRQLPIGNPLEPGVLVGPLIDERAAQNMQAALARARQVGGIVHGGERVTEGVPAGGIYVRPALVEIGAEAAILNVETFAPILYFLRYDTLDEAIGIHNAVPQGLSSSIFTTDLREAERFTSAQGSDCGIVNVNIGTSGAEIGGAFGGEKDTGGGRESGSDAWKTYMRRATVTVNYSDQLPLAQGIRFDVD
jgi:aldehyde dehydrogenase (NAD+)